MCAVFWRIFILIFTQCDKKRGQRCRIRLCYPIYYRFEYEEIIRGLIPLEWFLRNNLIERKCGRFREQR